MCGIFGIVSCREELLKPIYAGELKHRGPDDYGYYMDNRIALYHYRLAIQDLSAHAHQPMATADGRLVLIFNGEIYNHWELRRELLQGCVFKSTSDTETILMGYATYGKDFVKKLNGIFSIAIYDKELHTIFLARDQFGVKPLYYYSDQDCFAFSSELKSFLKIPSFNRKLDVRAIAKYIQFLWSPGSDTPFLYVKKLLPGHSIELKLEKPDDFRCLPFVTPASKPEIKIRPESEWVDELDHALQTAVRRQLLADVPVAYFISGGLDSSLIAAIARNINPKADMVGFTISNAFGKREGFTDDLPYAKMLADHLKMDLQLVDAHMNPLQEFDDMIWHLDEPQADAAPLMVSWIASLARSKGFPVLLSGTGGDDLFTGYQRHRALALDRFFFNIPMSFKKALVSLSAVLPTSNAFLRRLKKYAYGMDAAKLDERICSYFKWLPDDRLLGLFVDDIKEFLLQQRPDQVFLDTLKHMGEDADALEKMLQLEVQFFLPDHNLNYIDKLSMKHGVEVRVPYLDQDLVQLAGQIPMSLKMNKHATKYILRKVAERYLPHDLIWRPKTGFGGPIRTWIRSGFAERMEHDFNKESLLNQGLFNPEAIQQLIADNRASRLDAAYSVFALMAIQSWLRQFYQEESN